MKQTELFAKKEIPKDELKGLKTEQTDTLLISISGEYCERIFLEQTKKYELRKRWPEGVNRVLVYCKKGTSKRLEAGKVIGEFTAGNVNRDKPVALWFMINNPIAVPSQETRFGIDREKYDEYYKGKSEAIAIQIKSPIRYAKPKTLEEIGVKNAPQSYLYL